MQTERNKGGKMRFNASVGQETGQLVPVSGRGPNYNKT